MYLKTRNIFLISLLLVSCAPAQKQDNNQKVTVGEYVYLDIKETLHVKRHCSAIGKQTGELGGADRTVTRIPTEDVTTSMLEYTCSRCVSDSIYDYLLKISKDTRNSH